MSDRGCFANQVSLIRCFKGQSNESNEKGGCAIELFIQ